MAEVLSQNQIDELLNALKTGEVGYNDLESSKVEKKIRNYDFKIPKKFNKEQLKTLSIIYENYGRLLSSYLSGSLRTYCEVQALNIEEQRYFEYSNALPDNNMMGVIEMPPLQGTSMITVSQSLAFAIIDRLLGGQGELYETDRDYTEIEMNLMENVFREISTMLKDAWANVHAITPRFLRLEGGSRQSQMVSPNEIVVIVVLSVKIKDVEGTLSFCIPYVILEPVLEHLNTRYWFTERKTSEEDKKNSRETLMNKVNAIPMELQAILGTSRLTLREIMELHIGDVLQLDQRITDKAVVKSNDSDWFTGTVGLYQNHMAIRVENILMEGVVDDGAEPGDQAV